MMRETKLPESFTRAFQSSLIVALEWDIQDGTFFYSDSFDAFMISIVRPEDFMKEESFRSMVHPDDFDDVFQFLNTFRETRKRDVTVKRLLMKNGEWHWTRIAIGFISGTGESLRVIATLLDIHDFVEEKMRLERAENRFNTIIETIPMGIVIAAYDGDDRLEIEYISDQTLRIFGYSREVYELVRRENHPEGALNNLEAILKKSAQDLDGDQSGPFRTQAVRLDGTRIDLEIKGVSGKGEPPRFYVVLQEITQQVKEEKQARWQEERYRILSEDNGVVTFDYNPEKDMLIYSLNTDYHGRRDITIRKFSQIVDRGDFVHPQDLSTRNLSMMESRPDNSGMLECRIDFDGMGFKWFRLRWVSLRDAEGRIYRIVGRADSMEKEKASMAAMRAQQVLLQQILIQKAVFSLKFDLYSRKRVVAEDDVLPDAFPPVRNLDEWEAVMEQCVYPADRVRIWQRLNYSPWAGLTDEESVQTIECRIQIPGMEEKGYRWMRFAFFHPNKEAGQGSLILVYGIDQHEEKTADLILRRSEEWDSLTGVLNGTAFRSFYESSFEKAREAEPYRPVALLRIYLEKLDSVNVDYGTAYGDEVLRNAGNTIQAMVRDGDECARIHGAHFVVYIGDASNERLLRERVRIAHGALMQRLPDGDILTASIGMTTCSPRDIDSGVLYDQAEAALYQARKLGGNRVTFFSEGMEKGKLPENSSFLEDTFDLEHQVFIRTFGYFDIFLNGQPLVFGSAKAKELLALLVDRRGGFVSSGEAIAALWENSAADTRTLSRYRKVAMRLKNILEDYGILDILEIEKGLRRIVPERVECDLYHYLTGRPEYAQTYKGSYMLNYSWAEVTHSELIHSKKQ